jgi:hypothetical protein
MLDDAGGTDQGPEEVRRERFLRVAERRTRDILHKLRLLGNCSNKSAYSYTEEEVEQIFSVIQEQLNAARARFEPSKREDDFRLR